MKARPTIVWISMKSTKHFIDIILYTDVQILKNLGVYNIYCIYCKIHNLMRRYMKAMGAIICELLRD